MKDEVTNNSNVSKLTEENHALKFDKNNSIIATC